MSEDTHIGVRFCSLREKLTAYSKENNFHIVTFSLLISLLKQSNLVLGLFKAQ